MTRLLISLLIGLLLGIGAGVYIGWVQSPVEYINSPLGALDQQHLDDYTIMIAYGYSADGDLIGAVDRLRKLNVPSVPTYVQTVTERFITQGRNVADIRQMVGLAEAVGRLTPMMEAYRDVTPAS